MRKLTAIIATASAALGLVGCGASPASQSPARSARSSADPTGSGHPALSGAAAAPTSGGSAVATISTEGVGIVAGAPDTVTVGIGVQTSAPHAAGALARNNAVAAALQQALEHDGVAASDIQTSDLSLYEGSNPSVYYADDSVTATLHDLTKAGSVIDDAMAVAGDSGRLEGVTFSISDASPLMAAARRQAVAAARTAAAQLAAAAGLSIVSLASLSESPEQQNLGGFVGAMRAATGAPAMPVPLMAGSEQLQVMVTAVWRVAIS